MYFIEKAEYFFNLAPVFLNIGTEKYASSFKCFKKGQEIMSVLVLTVMQL